MASQKPFVAINSRKRVGGKPPEEEEGLEAARRRVVLPRSILSKAHPRPL